MSSTGKEQRLPGLTPRDYLHSVAARPGSELHLPWKAGNQLENNGALDDQCPIQLPDFSVPGEEAEQNR